MKPRVSLSLVSLFSILQLGACSHELGTGRATELIQEHLAEIAPHWRSTGGIAERDASVDLVVEEISASTDYERDVRFRLVTEPPSGESTQMAIAGDLMTAQFQHFDGGWELVHYGSDMVDLVAGLLVHESRLTYQDLIEVHKNLVGAYQVWEAGLRAVSSVAATHLANLTVEGPDSSTFWNLVDSLNLATPEKIRWGYVRPARPSLWKPVVWTGLADSTEILCADAIGDGHRTAGAGFVWIEGQKTNCKGRGEVFSELMAHDRAKARIEAAGGILRR